MKLLPFLCLLCSCYCGFAQSLQITESTSGDLDQMLQDVIAPLDLQQVPSGYLYDRIGELPFLDALDGQTPGEANSNAARSHELFYQYLRAMDVSANNVDLPAMTAYAAARNDAQVNTQAQPLALAYTLHEYHRIRDDALDLNLLYVANDQLHDAANRPQSPYAADLAFLASTVLDEVDGPDVQFVLPAALRYGNLANTVGTVEIDFDDGQGYRSVATGTPFTISYPGSDVYTLRYRLTTPTGVYTTESYLQVNVAVQGLWAQTADLMLFLPNATVGRPDTLRVFFSSGCTNQIKRPLLAVQGFNDGVIIKGVDAEQFKEKLESRFNFLSTGVDTLLDDAGYDLVYLSFADPLASMRDNAEVVKAAVLELETRKAQAGHNEPTVVIGTSMGGAVSKYALLEMEQAGADMNVSHLFTWDSPLAGANLPLSFQYAVVQAHNFGDLRI